MNEDDYYEFDSPHCGSCEEAQKDYAILEAHTADLVSLVMRLSRAMRKRDPQNTLANDAMGYLRSNNLVGLKNILREDV